MQEKNTWLDTLDGITVVVKTDLHFVDVEDIKRLRRGKWISGWVINAYLRLLVSSMKGSGLNVFVMPTRFWTVLTKRNTRSGGGGGRQFPCNYAKVKDWLIKSKVLHCDIALYPCSINGNHWGLGAVINRQPQTSRQYEYAWRDSYHSNGLKYYNCVETMYKKLFPDATKVYTRYGLGSKVHRRAFTTFSSNPELPPRQTNSCDCGAFMCANAYCILHHLPLNTFTAGDMEEFFREHMTISIMQNKLHELNIYPKILD